MPDGQMRPMDRLPILWVALGRQRVGKAALLNTAVQYFRAQGNPVRVWNADQQNRSHTLSMFFSDAVEVPAGGIEDGKIWIEGRIEDLIKHRYDAVLNVGGGRSPLFWWMVEQHDEMVAASMGKRIRCGAF
jgi:hypothetical protein